MRFLLPILTLLCTAKSLIIPFPLTNLAISPSNAIQKNTSLATSLNPQPPHFNRHRSRAPPVPSTDEQWARLICKGTSLVALMGAEDREAGQYLSPPQPDSARSAFTNFPGEFNKWGFFLQNDAFPGFGEHSYGLSDALRGLRVSRVGDDWRVWHLTHGDKREGAVPLAEQRYVVDGREYMPTGGDYKILVNKKDATMIFSHRYSVKYLGEQQTPPVVGDGLPALQRSCDIVWGLWTIEAGVGPLKHIISWAVSNDETISAALRALRSRGINSLMSLPDWPGVAFSTDTDEGKALLATPNGLGVGYMLGQHKYPLGTKTVKNIRIFLTDSTLFHTEKISVYFELGAAPKPPGGGEELHGAVPP